MSKIKNFLTYFIYAVFCLLLTVGCEQEKPQGTQTRLVELHSPTQLTRAIYSAHLQLDPHFVKAIADTAPLRDLLVGLMMFNPQGQVVPAIGKTFFSEDGMLWHIDLDENAKWSNGESVTAEDFVSSWRRLADPSQKSPLSRYLTYMGIKNAKKIITGERSIEELGVTAINLHQLQIQLEQPNFQLPKMLAHIALLPTYQGKKPALNQEFISNGEYKIKSHTQHTLILEALFPELPFQTVRYQLLTTVQNPDRFDIIENPLENYQRDLVYLPRLCTYFYEFNLQDSLLKRKEIRKAIRSMISSSEVGRNLGIPSNVLLPNSLISNDFPPFHTSAEQFLNSLGNELSSPIKLLLTYDNQGLHPTIAYRVARTLGQSDLFRVQLQAVDWKQLLAKRQQKSFQLIRSGWCADYPDPMVFLLPFHSESPDNKMGYYNPIVDQKLSLLPQISNSFERDKLIFEIIQQLDNDVVVIPLFQQQRKLSIAPDIIGVERKNSSEVIYSKDLYRQ